MEPSLLGYRATLFSRMYRVYRMPGRCNAQFVLAVRCHFQIALSAISMRESAGNVRSILCCYVLADCVIIIL